jgi:hypothetical protein
MNYEMLDTADKVIDALGGTTKMGRLTGQTPQTVHNWRLRKRIPAEYFLEISNTLASVGKLVTPAVFGMRDGGDGGSKTAAPLET